jgi:hypothetical protein
MNLILLDNLRCTDFCSLNCASSLYLMCVVLQFNGHSDSVKETTHCTGCRFITEHPAVAAPVFQLLLLSVN